jgi:hypothetical protein
MIRARYLSTTPFSFRREQATTKLAATYPCPTPYGAKVALIVGAIRAGLDPHAFTRQVRSAKIQPHPWGEGVINTHLVKHWEPPRKDSTGANLEPGYLSSTVVFREFVYFDGGVDLYFESQALEWLRPMLPCVNCFGKQGSLFTLQEVTEANPPKTTITLQGSDMKPNATWEKISNFTGQSSKPRTDATFGVAMHMLSGGGNYLHLKFHS